MLKITRLFLLALSVFIFCRALADEVKEPRIVKINDYLLVYEDVAEMIIKNVMCDKIVKENGNSVRICDDDTLLKKVIMLYQMAENKASHSDKQRFWVFDDKQDFGIHFDKDKKLIITLIMPE